MGFIYKFLFWKFSLDCTISSSLLSNFITNLKKLKKKYPVGPDYAAIFTQQGKKYKYNQTYRRVTILESSFISFS